jgi:hypothetical protein
MHDSRAFVKRAFPDFGAIRLTRSQRRRRALAVRAPTTVAVGSGLNDLAHHSQLFPELKRGN